jgi:hypothetical protein
MYFSQASISGQRFYFGWLHECFFAAFATTPSCLQNDAVSAFLGIDIAQCKRDPF